jgi:hypothetical protein
MLVMINQVPCSTNFVPIKYPIDSAILSLFFGLAHDLVIKINVAFEHALHSICIGKIGYTNVHPHENSVTLLYLT